MYFIFKIKLTSLVIEYAVNATSYGKSKGGRRGYFQYQLILGSITFS